MVRLNYFFMFVFLLLHLIVFIVLYRRVPFGAFDSLYPNTTTTFNDFFLFF